MCVYLIATSCDCVILCDEINDTNIILYVLNPCSSTFALRFTWLQPILNAFLYQCNKTKLLKELVPAILTQLNMDFIWVYIINI